MLGGDEPKAEMGAGPANPVAPPVAAPAAAPAAPVIPPVAPKEDDGDLTLESIKGIKIKPNDFQEMEVMRLMKPRDGAKGLTLTEAYQKVYGTPPSAVAKTEPTEAAPAASAAKSEFDTKIEGVTADITKLEADLVTAADAADVKEITRIQRELGRKERELERLGEQKTTAEKNAQTQREQAIDTTFRQSQLKARDQLIKEFPVLGDKASQERLDFDAWLNLKKDDPEYAQEFDNPRWPINLGREFAEAKGLSRTAKPAPTSEAPPVAPAAQRATAAAVITPGGNQGQQFQPTAESLKKDMKNMSVKDLDSLLG